MIADRRLVRLRDQTVRRVAAARVQLRRLLADYNLDFPELFTKEGMRRLKKLPLSDVDHFAAEQLLQRWRFLKVQQQSIERQLRQFIDASPLWEQEQRALLHSIPAVGFVTAEVVLAELADIRRFRCQKQVVAYAGLAPGRRESAGKRKELHLEKSGSKLLRKTLVEAAWRLVGRSPRWCGVYERLTMRMGRKAQMKKEAAPRLAAAPPLSVSAQTRYFFSTPSTSSCAAISEPWLPVFTASSMASSLPSSPM